MVGITSLPGIKESKVFLFQDAHWYLWQYKNQDLGFTLSAKNLALRDYLRRKKVDLPEKGKAIMLPKGFIGSNSSSCVRLDNDGSLECKKTLEENLRLGRQISSVCFNGADFSKRRYANVLINDIDEEVLTSFVKHYLCVDGGVYVNYHINPTGISINNALSSISILLDEKIFQENKK